MNRAPLLLALLGALAIAVLGALQFQGLKERAELQAQLRQESQRASKAENATLLAQSELQQLGTKIQGLEKDLGAARGNLATAEGRVAQLDRSLVQAQATVTVHEQNARALATELATLRQEVSDLRASNASPEAVAAYKNTIADLERQLAGARNGAAPTFAAGASTAVFASRVGVAKVLSVGPSNAFVVLNFGSERGGKIGQQLTVKQGTDVVATVLISDVRANFAIAQVLPETLRGVLQRGDQAVLIR